jgi:tripartite-type tricarboxylate transporter receptor subunit TctC
MGVRKRWGRWIVVALALAAMTVSAGWAADPKGGFVPKEPVTVIVPGAAGGSTDLLARAVEKVWSKYCPQPLLVVNKTGGGGVVGATAVARAKPDGYTLALGYGSGHDLVMPHIQKVDYNPFRDLDPVARLSIHSVVVLVPASSPVKNMKDLIAMAKKEKKPITASVGLTAGAVDLVIRGIAATSGIEITSIPHKGGAEAMTTLMGGQTAMGGGHPSEIIVPLKANRIRAIAIATPERDPSLPDVPTLIEQGINFHTWGSVKGIAVPKNTPKEIVAYYAEVFKKVTADPDFRKSMQDLSQPVLYLGPEDFGKFMVQASNDYAKLVKQLGLEQK